MTNDAHSVITGGYGDGDDSATLLRTRHHLCVVVAAAMACAGFTLLLHAGERMTMWNLGLAILIGAACAVTYAGHIEADRVELRHLVELRGDLADRLDQVDAREDEMLRVLRSLSERLEQSERHGADAARRLDEVSARLTESEARNELLAEEVADLYQREQKLAQTLADMLASKMWPPRRSS